MSVHRSKWWLSCAAVLALICFSHGQVLAEGTAQLGFEQALDGGTVLWVDIQDNENEVFVWTGAGTVEVNHPQAGYLGTFASGETIDPVADGAHRITLERDQFDIVGTSTVANKYDWDLTVYLNGVPQTGRLWSTYWRFNAGTFDQSDVLNASFFALVVDEARVIEMKFEGQAGYIYSILANQLGMGTADGQVAWSLPFTTPGLDINPQYQIYLNPPAKASYAVSQPALSEVHWQSQSGDCAYFQADAGGAFHFTSATAGTYHIVCDVDGDGLYELNRPDDLTLSGEALVGDNTISWDGRDFWGDPLDPMDFGDPLNPNSAGNLPILTCAVSVTVGELHYIAQDVETLYPGLAFYEVMADGTRVPLSAHWYDELVQANAVPMLQWVSDMERMFGVYLSPLDGLLGPAHGASHEPYRALNQFDETGLGNARAWGNYSFNPPGYTGLGKGNDAFLNTFTWLAHDSVWDIELIVLEPRDYDDDGLEDYEELCSLGSDYNDIDSDDDSVDDFVETQGGQPGVDTDGDGLDDVNDPDDDNDGLDTISEDSNSNGDPTDDDVDGDDIPDYLDLDDEDGPLADSDGDGTPNAQDGCPLDVHKVEPGQCGCGEADADSDQDGTADCNDGCPMDPDKTEVGICGCGVSDLDSDGDQTADCNDGCPQDPAKTEAGICGCGAPDSDSDGDQTADCEDGCPNDPGKQEAGECGCGQPETDSDQDGAPDCVDACPNDPNKQEAGDCGCGQAETDSDQDGAPDCVDACPNDPNKQEAGDCGCGQAETDGDQDGTPDCVDGCPQDAAKIEAGECGCGESEMDVDADGVPDCLDNCEALANTQQEDLDSDGLGDACDPDADGDGVEASEDCDDLDPDLAQLATFYRDQDDDGYGDPNATTMVCASEAPEGYVTDDTDNCPDVANPDQTDSDGDGTGDACQEDSDDGGGGGCSCSTGQGAGGQLVLLLAFAALFMRRRR